MLHPRRRRDKQAGRAILTLAGERADILFPDRGAAPLKTLLKRFQHRQRDGFGSHRDGRHKLG